MLPCTIAPIFCLVLEALQSGTVPDCQYIYDIFKRARPEEFVDTILMHAVHLDVVFFNGLYDARVGVIIVPHHTPPPNMVSGNNLWTPQAFSSRDIWSHNILQSCLFELKRLIDMNCRFSDRFPRQLRLVLQPKMAFDCRKKEYDTWCVLSETNFMYVFLMVSVSNLFCILFFF